MKLVRYLKFSQARAAEGHRPLFKQLLDMVWLFVTKRIGPGHYLQGKLWLKDKTWEDKSSQINEAEYIKYVARFNHPLYHKISQHKIVEKSLLSLFNIPTPHFLGYLHLERGTASNGLPLKSANDLEHFIRSEKSEKICIKKVEGFGGYGFRAVSCKFDDQDQLHLQSLDSEASMPVRHFFAELYPEGQTDNSYIIEQYLGQHPWYEALNASSLNTVRVYTLWRNSEQPQVVGALLRIGRAGNLVDNSSAGGIFAPVDITSGHLGPAQSFDLFDTSEFTHHPDTMASIDGEVLPYWEEIKDLTVRTLLLFPHTRFIGFDIAVSPNGPVVIETNVEPDKMGFVQTGLPIKDLLC